MRKGFTLVQLMTLVALLMLCAHFSHARVTASDGKKLEFQRTTLHLEAETIAIAEGGSGTNAFGGSKIYDFEEGRIIIHGVVADLMVSIPTNIVNDGSGINVALGTATAIASTGAVAHASTQADLCANVEVDPWTNGVTAFQGALATSAQFDGTSTAKDLYLNILIDDGDISTNTTATIYGEIEILWSKVGDY